MTAAAALFASAVAAAGIPAASSGEVPPMVVTVITSGDLSHELVSRLLAEAAAIWRPSGVSFIWRVAPARVSSSPAAEVGGAFTNTLRLTIGDKRGLGREGNLPLGWIVFDDVTVPEQEIYVSLTNAKAMMDDARGVVGLVSQMPLMQRDILLARAMGRALAHELGHYLLASKAHAPRGLMKATLTAVELFSPDATPLHIEPAQRRTVAERLRRQPMVASR